MGAAATTAAPPELKRSVDVAKRLFSERYEDHREQVSTSKHVQWAISKLTRRQKLFLRSFIQVVEESEHPTWEEICDRAGVVSERSYVTKLEQLGLLLDRPHGGIVANPVLTIDMIGLEEEVRKISNSLRFEVFQRDRHTCRYCGRRAPDVELELDHLIPVAGGGTDAFETKFSEAVELLMALGATKLQVEHVTGWSRDFVISMDVPLPISGVPDTQVGGEVGRTNSAVSHILFTATLSGTHDPFLPENLIWYPHERTWQQVCKGRLEYGLQDFSLNVRYQEDYGVNAGLKVAVQQVGLELGGEFKGFESTMWRISGEFRT